MSQAGKVDMAKDKKSKSSKTQDQPAAVQGSVHVEGNVVDSNIIIGSNNTIIIGGRQVTFRADWFYGHRYGDIENFTGRTAELKTLDDWLGNDKESLLMIRAFGGFGKSVLAWQWFNNRVDKAKWQTAVWWSFYEKESGFESFLAETLNHLGVEVKTSARQQLNDLLEAMRGTNILIVLDGFERLLRQYGQMDAALQSDDEDADAKHDPSQRDCSSPLTETFLRGLSGAGLKSKVLMTTRLCPRVLESADGKLLKGCREEPLAAFLPEDAVTYFHNEGIKATRAEVIEACAAYGYHPLSLSLLVGLINADHERRGDIAAVKNLEIFADVKARRHHVLERAYGSLAPERRDLLSKISCFRGSMEYGVLKKVFPSPDLDKALLDLRKRGLLQYAGETQRYDMHPIVRHYAYDQLDVSEQTSIHKSLRDYFQGQEVLTIPKTIDDLTAIVELYHHTVKCGMFDEAYEIYRTYLDSLYYQFGLYYLSINLLTALFDGDVPLVKEYYAGGALNALANSYALFGKPNYAVSLLKSAIKIGEKRNDLVNVAIRLGNLSNMAYLQTGALYDAESNLQDAIKICSAIGNTFYEYVHKNYLGLVLIYRGSWYKAKNHLSKVNSYLKKENHTQGQSLTAAYLSLNSLQIARKCFLKGQSAQWEIQQSVKFAILSLNLAKETEKINHPFERDYIRAYWLLGSAYRMNNELTLAEENLSKALNLCRQINLVEMEADILLDVARLRYAQGDFKDAQEKASEALVITERSGYVLQGADVNLFLAQYALEQEKDKAKAKAYAESALKLAYCDGPPYYYKVAYEEAERMLEMMNEE